MKLITTTLGQVITKAEYHAVVVTRLNSSFFNLLLTPWAEETRSSRRRENKALNLVQPPAPALTQKRRGGGEPTKHRKDGLARN